MTTADTFLDSLREVLARHPVSFALLFGSAARGAAEPRDLDIAVEFEDGVRVDGYSDTYLALLTDLESTLGVDVDLVSVAAMSPRFARVAFDDGMVVLGTERRMAELARRHAGERPSAADARARIAAVADRLTGGGSS